MTTTPIPTEATGAIPVVRGGSRRAGVGAVLASAVSAQTGGAAAVGAIASAGVPAVVAIRQAVAAVLLLLIVRPRIRGLGRRQVGAAVALGAATVTMNLGLYTALSRLGLGLAVTLEFLGPLAVAVLASRGRRDVAAAVLAAAGVVVLVRPGPSSDWIGIGCALVAASSWAAYILLNRELGTSFPGLHGTALAAAVGGLAWTPVLVVLASSGGLPVEAVLLAALAGVLCTLVPMAADVFALRRVPAGTFGVLASVNPVAAALAGFLLLGERLGTAELAGIGIVVAANLLATWRPRRRRPEPGRPPRR